MQLKTKLINARKKNKLTMVQVAEMSVKIAKKNGYGSRGNITQGYISRLESGDEANPSYLKLKVFSKIYKTPPGKWFED